MPGIFASSPPAGNLDMWAYAIAWAPAVTIRFRRITVTVGADLRHEAPARPILDGILALTDC